MGWGVLIAIVLGLAVFFIPTFPLSIPIGFSIFFLIAVLELVYQNAYYKRYYYDIREDFLVIKKGVIAPRETTLPYEKLQDVYLDQDVLDRGFSLYDLHVSTATSVSGSEAHIDGVNQQNAEAMKQMIIDKIKAAKRM